MSRATHDDLVATVAAIHAAGLDAELWPRALGAVTAVIGGVGAALRQRGLDDQALGERPRAGVEGAGAVRRACAPGLTA